MIMQPSKECTPFTDLLRPLTLMVRHFKLKALSNQV